MQTRTVERVETWDTRPFSGGAAALTSLADADFSGAVVADDVWLFFVNGRPVGVYGGTTADIAAAASGTVYEAPDLSLPLLFAMQEAGGETRARYYTNDTPLSETDDTLESAGFTGYVELSENVLSGDYYVAYYGGRSLPAAFVGNTPEVLTGEEAFERAADEVGLYEVVSVDLDFPDLPDVEDGAGEADAASRSAAAAATGTGASASVATRDEARDDEPAEADVPETSAAPEAETDAPAGDETAAAPDDAETPAESPTAADEAASEGEAVEDETDVTGDERADEGRDAAVEPDSEGDADEATGAGTGAMDDASEVDEATGAGTGAMDDASEVDATAAETAESAEPAPGSATSEGSAARPAVDAPDEEAAEQAPAARAAPESTSDPSAEPSEPASPGSSDVFHEEEAWRETTRVPTLAPDEDDATTAAGAETAETRSETPTRATASERSARSDTARESRRETVESEPARDERLETLESELAAREERVEALEERLESTQEEVAARERDLEDVRAERDDLRGTVERLEERIATLEADLEAARESAPTGPDDLSPAEAISGTNLFVRYESKAEPTLEDLGEADPSAIDANLSLEHHTTFDAADATVDGQPYEAFLHETAAYRFVSWAVRELPVEVLETGHRKGLADLYEAIPSVDRAELGGTVELSTEEGETVRRDFDVVLRDRMGDPLAVAALNTSRDPVTGAEMETLTDSASAVGELAESLGAALYVTASFFEPDALEVADEAAASGGLLRRSEKESYVKVSRKRGYHLCLVEDRNGSFHVTVPEL